MIDSDPEKKINYTFTNGESQKSDSRVTFSNASLMVSVSFQFGCFGQAAPTLMGLDVVRALDVIPDALRGKVYSRRLKMYLPTTTQPSGHLAWDLRTCLTDRDRCQNGRSGQ